MSRELAEWLNRELNERGWSQGELARRANISGGTLSMVMNQQRGAGPDLCSAIAAALRVPPEKIFRLAGLLPHVPEDRQMEQELLDSFHYLSRQERYTLLVMARALREASAGYHTQDKKKGGGGG